MILFILGLVLSIPLAVLANLCTPWIRIWFANRNASRRAKRIEKIKIEILEVSEYRNGSPILMIAYTGRGIIATIANFTAAVVSVVGFFIGWFASSSISILSLSETSGVTLFFGILSIIIIPVSVYQASRFEASLDRVEHFDKYKLKIAKQLSKLGTSIQEVWPEGEEQPS